MGLADRLRISPRLAALRRTIERIVNPAVCADIAALEARAASLERSVDALLHALTEANGRAARLEAGLGAPADGATSTAPRGTVAPDA